MTDWRCSNKRQQKKAKKNASSGSREQQIIDGFTPKAIDVFRREFDFFDKVTSISVGEYCLSNWMYLTENGIRSFTQRP
ncbi:hypothetical protein CsSME_00051391 [Camellia sinensis var. sinensis]